MHAAHIEELRKQNADLSAQISRLAAIVRSVPALILEARLDAKAGRETRSDYEAHHAALNQ